MMEDKKVLNEKELENVSGGYTIKPKESEMWYSFNPAFVYDQNDK